MDEAVRRIVERFGLSPHPEGGFYREVWRSEVSVAFASSPAAAGRSAVTQIYYLLPGEQFSAFHRVKGVDEIWHLYAGGPLELHVIDPDGRHQKHVLTTDPGRGEPVAVVPAGWWQAARPAPGAAYAFTGCTVAPGFDFADFEMPPAAEIIAAHPQHETVIRELTRE